MTRPNVVGILGCDYCGSTTLNAIFNCLPNVLAVGESHWIIDKAWNCKNCKNIPCPEHASCPDCSTSSRCEAHRVCKSCELVPCPLHGRCRECESAPCRIFTDELLTRLRTMEDPHGQWWSTIAESANVSNIVSADKKAFHYDKLGVPDYLLLVAKDAREHVLSFAKRRPKDPAQGDDPRMSDEAIEAGINSLFKGYQGILRWIKRHSFSVRVENFELVLDDPRTRMREICEWCGIEYVDCDFDYANHEQHYIGGNFSLKRHPQYREKHSNTRWMNFLTEKQQQRILEDENLRSIAESLKQLDPTHDSHFMPISSMQ